MNFELGSIESIMYNFDTFICLFSIFLSFLFFYFLAILIRELLLFSHYSCDDLKYYYVFYLKKGKTKKALWFLKRYYKCIQRDNYIQEFETLKNIDLKELENYGKK